MDYPLAFWSYLVIFIGWETWDPQNFISLADEKRCLDFTVFGPFGVGHNFTYFLLPLDPSNWYRSPAILERIFIFESSISINASLNLSIRLIDISFNAYRVSTFVALIDKPLGRNNR